jgi:hypothetical protein
LAEGDAMVRGPWWIELIKTIGPTAVIALGLVYWLTQSLSPVLSKMNDFIMTHEQQTVDLIDEEKTDSSAIQKQWDLVGKMADMQHRDREASLKLEQQTCVNTAKSLYQSQKCLDIRNDGESIGP